MSHGSRKTVANQLVNVSSLESEIARATHAYYNTSKPIMSDAQFDLLLDELARVAPESPVLKKVGAPVPAGTKVKLPYPMMSLDKLKSGTGARAARNAGPYVIADKLDGTSAMLAGGRMFRRGTGTHGADISHLIALVKGANVRTHMAVRGEIIIRKADASRVIPRIAKDARSAVNALVTSKQL
jgi:NAD-dependent DNA ligase